MGASLSAPGSLGASYKLHEVYTGAAFNSSGSSSASYEMTNLAASAIAGKNYLIIRTVVNTSLIASAANSTAFCQQTFQTRETAGAYSDSMAIKNINFIDRSGYAVVNQATHGAVITTEWIHTLTAGEKANGVQVKIIGTTVTNLGTVSQSNIQTSLFSMP